jgi:hypothetical protein
MEINFNPMDLIDSDTYYNSWISRLINSKMKLTLIYNDNDLKFENMQVWIQEMQDWQAIESYNVDISFTKKEREKIYNEMFSWKISDQTETTLYSMLPFEEKYIDKE